MTVLPHSSALVTTVLPTAGRATLLEFTPMTSTSTKRGAVDPRVPSPDAVEAVPYGVRVAAAWIWRLLLVGVGVMAFGYLVSRFSGIAIPLAIALLLTALLLPFKQVLARVMPSPLATLISLVLGLALVGGALYGIFAQIASESQAMVSSAQLGLEQLMTWLTEGPLDLAPDDVQAEIDAIIAAIPQRIEDISGRILNFAMTLGTQLGSFFTGLFVMLFAMIFFLHDGRNLWSGVLKLTPRAARPAIDTGAMAGWKALMGYVRTTILVAAIDAIGILIGAMVLGVPMAGAIAALTFLGAFIPIVGAVVAGLIGVLIALVTQGWVTALIFLGVVLLVQQIEGNVLQPFLMGKAVSLHPLAILLGISVGVTLGGIVGAVVAVPILAVIKAFTESVANRDWLQATPAEDLHLSEDDIEASNALGGGSESDLATQKSAAAPTTAELAFVRGDEEDEEDRDAEKDRDAEEADTDAGTTSPKDQN